MGNVENYVMLAKQKTQSDDELNTVLLICNGCQNKVETNPDSPTATESGVRSSSEDN